MSENTNNTNSPDVKVEEFNLEYHLYSLLEKEPFFAAISRHVQKAKSKSIPTAGVRVTEDGNYEMLYNPDFFAKLPPIQRLGVLKHEFYHLVLEHVSERLPDTGMTKDWNIATDLSINGLIPDEIPEFGCIPGKGPFADYPAGQTAEWYYNRIQQDKKDGKDRGGDSMDDHSEWGEGNDLPDEVKELAKQRIKEMMKEASKEANQTSNGWGNMPMNIRQDILDRINPKVNWRNVLRYFIKTSTRANKTRTLKRLNKRFPFIHSGVKVERRAKIAISIDQSGSVSDELLVKFFSELDNLARLAEFTVVPFDTEVNEKLVYTWKKGAHKKAERVKYGGTDFNAPTQYVNEHKFDGHIVLTDMCAPKPIASNCQRLWMTDKANAAHQYFTTTERVIVID